MALIRLEGATFIRRGIGMAEFVLVGLLAALVGLALLPSFMAESAGRSSSSVGLMYLLLGLFGASMAGYRHLKKAISPKYSVGIRDGTLVITPRRGDAIVLAPSAIRRLRYGYTRHLSFANPTAPRRDVVNTVLEIESDGLAQPLRLVSINEQVDDIIGRMGEVERGNKRIEFDILASTFAEP